MADERLLRDAGGGEGVDRAAQNVAQNVHAE